MGDIEPTAAIPAPVIALPAEIDFCNADRVRAQLAAASTSGAKVIIADMSGTTFCDSLGIRVLVQAWRQTSANHAELRLVAPGRHVMRIMEVLGLEKALPIFPSLEKALDGADAAEM